MPHATQLSAADTGLLVVDVQEKLLPKILDPAALIRNIRFLLDGAKLLQIPAQATEQYPRGLGATVSELLGYFPQRPDKTAFSSCAARRSSISSSGRRGRRSSLPASKRTFAFCTRRSTC